MCFAAQIRFCCESDENGRREVKIVWSGNNGCHMSQEIVIKHRVDNTLHFLTRIVFEGFLRRILKVLVLIICSYFFVCHCFQLEM